jgi:predicted XRE-type DNA-binding protein
MIRLLGSRNKEQVMDARKQKALESAGWRVGDAADFLEMSEEERQLFDARVAIALAIRRQREAHQLSQKELGARLKTSQPRVAKIERAAPDVSLDQLVRALVAAGGSIAVRVVGTSRKKVSSPKKKTGKVRHAPRKSAATHVFELA